MRSVLVTRPQPVADEFAEKLRHEGFYTYVAPMTHYVAMAADLKDLSGYQALVFTSAQAVHFFAGLSAARDLPVLAVGDMTAASARKAGFAEVHSAKGDSKDVASLIRTEAASLALKKILHLCSDDTGGEIGAAVAGLGIEVVRMPIYKAEFLDTLPEDVMQALQRGGIDAVTLFSARTAENFVQLLLKKDLRAASSGLEAVCISERVAAELKELPWRAVRIARQPTMDAVMEILKKQSPGVSSVTPLSADQVISSFGGLRPLANRLGITASTVQGWKKRGLIPEGRVDAVLAAAKQDHIDTKRFWQEASEDADDGMPSERRKSTDRRQKQPVRDEHGLIHADAYTGPDRRGGVDRRAYEKRQQKRVLNEKMRFMNRSVLTFAFIFIAVVLAGVFLMAPEYIRLKDRAKMADRLEEQVKLFYPKKKPEAGKTSIGGTLNRGIEKVGNAADRLASSLDRAAQPDFMRVLDNVAAMRRTAGGEEQVVASLKTLRSLLAASPGNPEEISLSVDAARRRDPTLNSLLEPVGGRDLAAAAMLLTLNEFRNNVSRQRPYAEDLALLRRFAGNDPGMNRALKKLAPYAERGVMSREALQSEFKGLASDIVLAKLRGEDVSVQEAAQKRFQKLARAGQASAIRDKGTEAAVARAQIFLAEGNVKEAMRELQSLDGASAEVAGPWVDEASGSVIAGEASDDLTQSLLQAVMGGDSGFSAQDLFARIKEKIMPPKVLYISPSFTEGGGENTVLRP